MTIVKIKRSPTADSRTCDPTTVTPEVLYDSSEQHIEDVRKALHLFIHAIGNAAQRHDVDKLTDIKAFHADFQKGFPPEHRSWLDRHYTLNRHHLTEPNGVPEDVDLIDVLDFIADCVCAGLARSGDVYPLHLPDELLQRAFQNTVAMLKKNIEVVE